MKKIENLTNLYSVSKTLQFKLIPVGKTEENYEVKRYLANDQQLAKDAEVMKEKIRACHRKFVEDCLSNFALDVKSLDDYYAIYKISNADKQKLNKLQKEMKATIYKTLTSDERYDRLFGNKMIEELLANLDEEDSCPEESRKLISSFVGFTTYFKDFNKNLKNAYTNKNISTEIVYRLINQNLNKFLYNCKLKETILSKLSTQLDELYSAISEKVCMPFTSSSELKGKIFEPAYFNSVLTQGGIDLYNQLIGGFTTDDKKKIKGFNEYINEYNQNHSRAEQISKMKQLYKQIFSVRQTPSYIPKKFEKDNEVLTSVRDFYKIIEPELNKIKELFTNLTSYDISHIYVDSRDISKISNIIFKDWSEIRNYFYDKYDKAHLREREKNYDKFEEAKNKYFKKINSYSLADILCCANEKGVEEVEFVNRLNQRLNEIITTITNSTVPFFTLRDTSKLLGDNDNTEIIKNLLDTLKGFKDLFNIFDVENDEIRDEIFYDAYDKINAHFIGFADLYDMVRNYLTQKLYSQDKIKLKFGNSQLFDGWDLNKENDYLTVMLRKGNDYYVGIIDKENKNIFKNMPECSGERCYEKMVYKFLPSPNKMLPHIFIKSKNQKFQPPKEIKDKYERDTHLNGANFNLSDCHALIDYFKSCIYKYEDWACYDFHFSDTSTYKNIADFYNEISKQGYKVSFIPVAESYIESCIEQGKLLLYRIYNKDFSEYSKGKKNLHTMYFMQLFSEENLANPVFKLNGCAEMFYRFASPKLDPNEITHRKNEPIKNKNPLNVKKESVFEYDIIKDKRYRHAQFSFHVPININVFDGDSGYNKVSYKVRAALRECDDNYVIGIDRGERNLLYVSVINGQGNIVEQFSSNIVEDDYNSQIKTDYHNLLAKREDERNEARKSWKSINGIKDLKNGYLSQVVHKICLLVEKYDAVIAMEDLNSGFKNGRKKVEKSVYQQFEKALIEKLNFLTFKDRNANDIGGLRHAYQLTDKFESFQKMKLQNGIIFYIPAWNTSKIDPTTGFVDMLNTKYGGIEAAGNFFKKFDNISYDSQTDMFAFTFNYSDFGKSFDYKNKWTVYTYGDRIETYQENNKFDCRKVLPTELIKSVFESVGIAYVDGHNLVDDICAVKSKDFYVGILKALKLTLQMRNSNAKTGEDYIISPVKNKQGEFFDSRNYSGRNAAMPIDADANGAYHIAKKCLWAIKQIKAADEGEYLKTSISIKNQEWLRYMQSGD